VLTAKKSGRLAFSCAASADGSGGSAAMRCATEAGQAPNQSGSA